MRMKRATTTLALVLLATVLAPPAQATDDDAPILSLQAPELLGRTTIALVPGVWTVLVVDVDNTGTQDAPDTVLTGSGKGLEVRPVALGTALADFGAPDSRIEVRLAKKRATTVTLTATSGVYSASTSAAVRPVAPPARPEPGRYSSKDGDVTFRITTGKKPRVVGLDAQVGATCGSFPQFTYPTQLVGYPATRIARNGIVDVTSETDEIYRELAFKISGGRVTLGRLYFNGAGFCYGSELFTARRVTGN